MDIKSLREAAGMTQERLADACGVTRQAISHIEASKRTPSIPLAKSLAAVLGCKWTDFYEEEKDEKTERGD